MPPTPPPAFPPEHTVVIPPAPMPAAQRSRAGLVVALVVLAVAAVAGAVALYFLVRSGTGDEPVEAASTAPLQESMTTTGAKVGEGDVPNILRRLIGDTGTSSTYYLASEEAGCFARLASERLSAEEAAALVGGKPSVEIVGKVGPAFDQCIGAATLARMYADITTQLLASSGVAVTPEEGSCVGAELAATLRFSELALRNAPGTDAASVDARIGAAATACGVA